ncbi:MAG: hypothetical protein F4039_07320 [Gammaproteobacteria bacterium]|nr:hypothetical protein [Gammaproteobacteria bacterium]MYK43879.1 hypothetical protein [Gammaproteobacteria bacterium]
MTEQEVNEKLKRAAELTAKMSNKQYNAYVRNKMEMLDPVMFGFVQAAMGIFRRAEAVSETPDIADETKILVGWVVTGIRPNEIPAEDLND